jgi:transposase InsO family protein
MKSDNGPAYRSTEVQSVLRSHDVLHLFSPPATPSYNGSCEAGVGSIKTRAFYEAARHDRPEAWTCEDIEAARCQANETARPWGPAGPTPQERFDEKLPITQAERSMFLASYKAYAASERHERGISLDAQLDHYQQASIDRVAIVRALVEHGYLQFRRRRVTPPIVRRRAVKIA